MFTQEQELRRVAPDLRNLPAEQLAVLGDSALAQALALYRRRLEAGGDLICAFDSKIEV